MFTLLIRNLSFFARGADSGSDVLPNWDRAIEAPFLHELISFAAGLEADKAVVKFVLPVSDYYARLELNLLNLLLLV